MINQSNLEMAEPDCLARGWGANAVRHMLENVVLTDLEVSTTFLQVMSELKSRHRAYYDRLVSHVKAQPQMKHYLQYVMLDVFVAANVCEMVLSEAEIKATLKSVCRPCLTEESKLIVHAVLSFFWKDMPQKTKQLIINQMRASLKAK